MLRSTPTPAVQEKMDLLKNNGVNVDYVLKEVFPVRSGDVSVPQGGVDDSCARCQASVLPTASNLLSLRMRSALDKERDNILWAEGSKIVFTTVGTWPDEGSKQLVAAALIVSCHVWDAIALGISVVFSPTGDGATHAVRYGDVSRGNAAAEATFPWMEGEKRVIFYRAGLVPAERPALLSRTLHEVGHCLGFYHEHEGDDISVRVGARDAKSIMSYERDRYFTANDIQTFKQAYTFADGTSLSPGVRVTRAAPVKLDLRNADAAIVRSTSEMAEYSSTMLSSATALLDRIKAASSMVSFKLVGLADEAGEQEDTRLKVIVANIENVVLGGGAALGVYPPILGQSFSPSASQPWEAAATQCAVAKVVAAGVHISCLIGHEKLEDAGSSENAGPHIYASCFMCAMWCLLCVGYDALNSRSNGVEVAGRWYPRAEKGNGNESQLTLKAFRDAADVLISILGLPSSGWEATPEQSSYGPVSEFLGREVLQRVDGNANASARATHCRLLGEGMLGAQDRARQTGRREDADMFTSLGIDLIVPDVVSTDYAVMQLRETSHWATMVIAGRPNSPSEGVSANNGPTYYTSSRVRRVSFPTRVWESLLTAHPAAYQMAEAVLAEGLTNRNTCFFTY